jgi:hypothetical protein
MEAIRVTRRWTAIALTTVIALSSCSDSARPQASSASSFPDAVCTAISDWGREVVDAANAFTDETAHLSDAGRRARYLFAFDEQARITTELRDELEAAPPIGVVDAEAIRVELLHAVDDVTQNIHDQKADAAEHVDFHFIGPTPDRLFAGTEKSLSLMLKPLDEIARGHHVDALGGSCGR